MSDDRLRRVGAAIRAHRLEQRLTQGELGTRAGISRPSVNGIEAGRQEPGLFTFVSIASVLNCKAHELLREALAEAKTTDDEWVRAVLGKTEVRDAS